MTILSAAALALMLATDPAPAPEAVQAPPAAVAAPDLTPAPLPVKAPESAGHPVEVTAAIPIPSSDPASSTVKQVQAGVGISVTDADRGVASTFQAGVQVDPWELFGFRGSLGMTTSVFGAGGWDAAEVTGGVLVRPFGNQRRVVPYAGVGVVLALLAIFPDPVTPATSTLPKFAGRHPPLLMSGEGTFPAKPDGFGGTNQFKVIPELTAGATVRLTRRLGLDVAARYLPLSWNGSTYNGLSVVASICAPF
jgi:hypothetical protein